MADFDIRELLEAGTHFGHQTRRWNPKMEQYIFGERNGVHIIDLEQTVPMLFRALEAVRDVAAGGGRGRTPRGPRRAQPHYRGVHARSPPPRHSPRTGA